MHYPPVRQTESLNKRSITVYGNSKMTLQPNVAEIQLGVEVRDLDLTVAQQENARIIQQVIQSLLNFGVAQGNIQTVDFHIFPQYDFVDGNQQFRGYQVTHMLSLTIDNPKQAGIIIDTAVQSGANRVTNIKFTVKNIETYYQQALKLALEDASAKARTIANAMRLPLDPTPIQILEQTTTPPPTPYQTFTETGVVAGVSTPIEPGRLEIEARVEVKFHY